MATFKNELEWVEKKSDKVEVNTFVTPYHGGAAYISFQIKSTEGRPVPTDDRCHIVIPTPAAYAPFIEALRYVADLLEQTMPSAD